MKHTLWILIAASIVTVWIFLTSLNRTKPRVVFCNVGQGDAVYFRLQNGADVLVDTGKGTRVVTCLNENMPLFDRKIEAVFITHAQSDHADGLISILQSFTVQHIFTSPSGLTESEKSNYPLFWQEILSTLHTHHQSITPLVRDQTVSFGSTIFTILWPPQTSVYTPTMSDPNNTALGMVVMVPATEGFHTVLLLSDMDAAVAETALQGSAIENTIWKVNHHGSKNGISAKLIHLAQPMIAVISAGKNNLYGHPHKETLDLLHGFDIPIRRTDLEGSVTLML